MSRKMGLATGPELQVSSLPYRAGFGFRRHAKGLPRKPDIVLPKYRSTIYVHGCFWDRHECCRNATTPATGTEFWREKFDGSV